MRNWLFRWLFGATAVGLMLALGVTQVAAAEITVAPGTVGPDSRILVSGQDFIPNDTVTVTVTAPNGETVSTVTMGTDGAGLFGGLIDPPAGGYAPGTYEVTATGTAAAFQANAAFAVAGGPPAPATTGGNVAAVPVTPVTPAGAAGQWMRMLTTGTDLETPTAADNAAEAQTLLSEGQDPSQFPAPTQLPALATGEAAAAATAPAS